MWVNLSCPPSLPPSLPENLFWKLLSSSAMLAAAKKKNWSNHQVILCLPWIEIEWADGRRYVLSSQNNNDMQAMLFTQCHWAGENQSNLRLLTARKKNHPSICWNERWYSYGFAMTKFLQPQIFQYPSKSHFPSNKMEVHAVSDDNSSCVADPKPCHLTLPRRSTRYMYLQ